MKRLVITLLIILSSNARASGIATESLLTSIATPAIGIIYSAASNDIEGLKELGMSCLVTAQLVTFLKYTVHRHRPDNDDDLSFPSGHAAASFMGASYLQHRYGWKWGVPMYALAAVVSYQRVDAKDHYWSDVIAGAAIGYGIAAFFTVDFPNVRFEPLVDTQTRTYGFKMTTNFG